MPIRFVVMDVDGTLTDGKIYIGQAGEMFKAFNVKDGYAIKHILPKHNIIPVIITSRSSQIVEQRCKELSISECYQASADKLSTLLEVLRKYSLLDNQTYSLAHVLYIGDDEPDLACMQAVAELGGIVACPQDAIPTIKQIATYTSPLNGGDAAVRDIIDWLLKQ